MLSTGLLFALPVSVLLERRRPSPVEWSWAALLVVGLVIFLVVARPGTGPPLPDDRRLVMCAGGVGALVAIAAAIGYGPGRRHRAALLGFATGLAYGITAALIKYCVALSRSHPTVLLTSWPAYTLVAVGTAAIMLNQAAYQAGPLAGALPAIVIMDSIVAITITISATAFHEAIRTTTAATAFQALGFATMALAIVALAKQASGRHSRSPTSTRST